MRLAFADMKSCDVGSSMYSVSGVLKAAAELAALEQCRILYTHAVVTGLDVNLVVGTALVDVYGKAGFVSDARQVFNKNFLVLNLVDAVSCWQHMHNKGIRKVDEVAQVRKMMKDMRVEEGRRKELD
ncbi:pentatricopeptide repeat-containing protein At4g14850-like [Rosa rugosa]|uniref:pentatricopeptide repeat-containing protein At4g14850-like n=1 Tax=Rosa rugosa TaxID=74645 RepID=UPI002B40803F|nr:pentatricopeptide repeat-containing protein At4g14850-like [Rosa rugosa]